MTAPHYQILFEGRCLPGFDEDAVRAKLAGQLKLSAPQIAAMFQGRTVALKRGLTAEQAETYLARLSRLGLDVAKAPDPRSTATAPSPATTGETGEASPPAPAAEPTHTLRCYRCGAPVSEPGFCADCRAKTASTAPETATSETIEEDFEYPEARIFGLAREGRLGCLRYTIWMTIALVIAQLSGASLIVDALGHGIRGGGFNVKLGAVLLLYAGILLFSLRLALLRLRDLNLGGQWLLGFIAVFAALLAMGPGGVALARTQLFWGVLLLTILSGARGDNDYGPPDDRPRLAWIDVGPRIGRLRYFGLSMLCIVVLQALGIVVIRHLLGSAQFGGASSVFRASISLMSVLPSVFALTLAAALRLMTLRLNDIGRSGIWIAIGFGALLLLHPVLGSRLSIFSAGGLSFGLDLLLGLAACVGLALVPGQSGANRFGEAETLASTRWLWLGPAGFVLSLALATWMQSLIGNAKQAMLEADRPQQHAQLGNGVAERMAGQGWVVILHGAECPDCDRIAEALAPISKDASISFCNVEQKGGNGTMCRALQMEVFYQGAPLPAMVRSCGKPVTGDLLREIKAGIADGSFIRCDRAVERPPTRERRVHDVARLGTAGMPPVTLFTRRACENCDRTRDWLESHRIPFSECAVDQRVACHRNPLAAPSPRELPEVWVGDYRLYDTASRTLEQAFGFDSGAKPGSSLPSLPRLLVFTAAIAALFGAAVRFLRRARLG